MTVTNGYHPSRELYHGRRWNTDPRFRTPMVNLSNGASIFVRDVITFEHPYLGCTKGLVTDYFLKVRFYLNYSLRVLVYNTCTCASRKDVQMCVCGVDALLDGVQFNMMSEGPPVTLSHDTVILYEHNELPVSCIHGVAAAPQCIVRWHGELNRFERFASEVMPYVVVQE